MPIGPWSLRGPQKRHTRIAPHRHRSVSRELHPRGDDHGHRNRPLAVVRHHRFRSASDISHRRTGPEADANLRRGGESGTLHAVNGEGELAHPLGQLPASHTSRYRVRSRGQFLRHHRKQVQRGPSTSQSSSESFRFGQNQAVHDQRHRSSGDEERETSNLTV
jgi:hypothetical protein